MCLLLEAPLYYRWYLVVLQGTLPPLALVGVVPIGEQRKVQSHLYLISHQMSMFLEVLQSNVEEERSLKSHHVAAR